MNKDMKSDTNKNIEKTSDENVMPEKVAFETEDGTEEFYILEQTMLGGINYIIVTDDPDSEEGSFLILKEGKGDASEGDFTSYELLEDENELRSVVAVFNELLEDVDLEV